MNKKQFKFSKLHILALSLVVFITGVFAAIFGMKRSPIISGASTTYNFETITLNDSAFTLVPNTDNKYPDVGTTGSYLVFNGNITIPTAHTGSYDEWELNIPSQYKYAGTTYKVKEIRTGEMNAGPTGFKYDAIFPKKPDTGVYPDRLSVYESIGIPVEKIKKSQNVAFVVTKEGGHVGFFQNWNTKITYSEEVTLDFIETVTKIKNSANKH
jgi:hypothetical protein